PSSSPSGLRRSQGRRPEGYKQELIYWRIVPGLGRSDASGSDMRPYSARALSQLAKAPRSISPLGRGGTSPPAPHWVAPHNREQKRNKAHDEWRIHCAFCEVGDPCQSPVRNAPLRWNRRLRSPVRFGSRELGARRSFLLSAVAGTSGSPSGPHSW